ncbi:MAG: phosphoribosylformylglycinamidine synthase [Bacteroidetes bacterium QS_8_64_10]|jgi:phosphoribosylformylglycinamidine synthase|nr:MAG: phosphoribosylformylglycinamidine synthase [Bacteroidetes bacterium QS_8_64_10]
MFKAKIHVTLRPSILDPEGKTIRRALGDLGYRQIEEVRTGKYIELSIEAADAAGAEEVAREACEKLLANPVMENFSVEVERAAAAKTA